jgi:hypothetical protein
MKKLALVCLVTATMAVAMAFSNFTKAHVTGTWLLNGKDTNNKWVFYKDDKFLFKGAMSSSKGTWSTDGKKVHLVWTEIDGQPVAKKGSIKGAYPLLDDGSFQVDNYNFKKKQ